MPCTVLLRVVVEFEEGSACSKRGAGAVDCLDELGRCIAGGGFTLGVWVKRSPSDLDIKGPAKPASGALANGILIAIWSWKVDAGIGTWACNSHEAPIIEVFDNNIRIGCVDCEEAFERISCPVRTACP